MYRTSCASTTCGTRSGGDIFKLSRILGNSSVAITERTYAHLKPNTFEADYHRVRVAMPGEGAQVLPSAPGR